MPFKEVIAVGVSAIAGLALMVLAMAVWSSSTAFWHLMPNWAPIPAMASFVGIATWIICRICFFIFERFSQRLL